jgi:hypothetical protein
LLPVDCSDLVDFYYPPTQAVCGQFASVLDKLTTAPQQEPEFAKAKYPVSYCAFNSAWRSWSNDELQAMANGGVPTMPHNERSPTVEVTIINSSNTSSSTISQSGIVRGLV